jgi:hypothetical protein
MLMPMTMSHQRPSLAGLEGANLGSVASGLAEQLSSITEEMNKIRQELYGESGIGGIASELERLKSGGLSGLLDESGAGAGGGAGASSSGNSGRAAGRTDGSRGTGGDGTSAANKLRAVAYAL